LKCIKCETDNRLKDREDGRCGKCRHPIVFDPRRHMGDLFNDKQFERSVELISVNRTLKFTPRQYYFFLNSMKGVNPPAGAAAGCGTFLVAAIIFFFGVITGHAMAALVPAIIITLIGIAFLPNVRTAFGAPPHKSIKVSKPVAMDAFARWSQHNNPINLVLPSIHDEIPPKTTVAKELLEYSFDRLIVTEIDEIAQFLIANNFHFENNCAVLSINKYPKHLFSTIMKMLDNNPELKVYALHDCSWRGIAMLEKLRNSPEWFKDRPNVQIIDLGLLPRQIQKKSVFVEGGGGSATEVATSWKNNLTEWETHWLDQGDKVPLESIAPQALIRMITLGIAMSKDPTQKDALVQVDSGSGGGGGDGIFIYTSDSFG
jgi:hypothetical protein